MFFVSISKNDHPVLLDADLLRNTGQVSDHAQKDDDHLTEEEEYPVSYLLNGCLIVKEEEEADCTDNDAEVLDD